MNLEKRMIKIKLLTEMLGTIPKNKEVYSTYIESKKPKNKVEDETETIEETEEKGWTGFHSDETGLFIYEYMIKGFLKNAGKVLKDHVKIKALRSKIDDRVFIAPRQIYLNKNKPDSYVERYISIITPQGPRTTVLRSDSILAGTELSFEISWLKSEEITESVILELFEYGKLTGLGQFRNGGYGRFEVIEVMVL